MGRIAIEPVATARERERFIRVPERLYAVDPAWIAPLRREQRAMLAPSHPYFSHGEAAFWIARADGRDVGRISAQMDRLVRHPPGERIGHFGALAAADDPAVVAALTGAAEAWLRARGATRALGPFTLSINQETGLLVDGFDTPAMLMMPHDPPWLARHIEASGYAKAKDLLAYLARVGSDLPLPILARLAKGMPETITLRPLDRSRYAEEIATVTAIFNDAWRDNWGFVPLTEADTAYLAKALKPLLHDRLVWFVEASGRPLAFGLCLPNLNEAIRDLGGRLLPFGWARLLWRLKVRGVRTARVPLFGVRREAAAGAAGSLIAFCLLAALRREAIAAGFEALELSWILEDNRPMRRILAAIGAEHYKTWRVYEKPL